MIVEAFISVLVGFLSFIGGLFPTVEPPGWMGAIASNVSTVTGYMAPLGHWVPFGAAGNAVEAVLLACAAALVIRLVRIVLSLFTGGGGSAG